MTITAAANLCATGPIDRKGGAPAERCKRKPKQNESNERREARLDLLKDRSRGGAAEETDDRGDDKDDRPDRAPTRSGTGESSNLAGSKPTSESILVDDVFRHTQIPRP